MNRKFISISIVSILLIVFVGFWLLRSQPQIMPEIKNTDNTKPITNNLGIEIQGWIYPGPPACNAMSELQDGRIIDVAKPEYFTLTESGDIRLLTEEADGCNAYTKENADLVKAHTLQQYVTISANHIYMRELFKDDQKVTVAVNTLVNFVKEHDFTGAEVDFEEFSAWTRQDYANYKTFLQRLGDSLHTINKRLLVDTPPITDSIAQYYQWDYRDFNSLPVDGVVVMAYDYQYDNGKGSAIAPNAWVEEVVSYTRRYFTDDTKLIIGIPTYGYHATEDFRFALDTYEQSGKYAGFKDAKISPDSYEMQWVNNGTFYTYQSSEGIAKKIDFIRNLGIKSVSLWHLGGNNWPNW